MRQYCHIFSISAWPKPEQESWIAPSSTRAKSEVTRFCAMVSAIVARMISAASTQPIWRSIISADKLCEQGLTLSCPAYRGTVPCEASNIDTDTDRSAPGQTRARPPERPMHRKDNRRSDSMSQSRRVLRDVTESAAGKHLQSRLSQRYPDHSADF